MVDFGIKLKIGTQQIDVTINDLVIYIGLIEFSLWKFFFLPNGKSVIVN